MVSVEASLGALVRKGLLKELTFHGDLGWPCEDLRWPRKRERQAVEALVLFGLP